jgi:hypothetical protein
MTNTAIKTGEVKAVYLRRSWEGTNGVIDVTPPPNDDLAAWECWAKMADKARKEVSKGVGVK